MRLAVARWPDGAVRLLGMIPVRDDVPLRTASLVVGALIAANSLAFAYTVSLLGGWADVGALEFTARWGLVPREFLREIADPGSTAQIVWLTPITPLASRPRERIIAVGCDFDDLFSLEEIGAHSGRITLFRPLVKIDERSQSVERRRPGDCEPGSKE